LFVLLGPLNWLIDLGWLSGDRHRQSLRDKFAQTYVIRQQTHPAGRGPIVFSHYDIFGFSFLFQEVES
jgi:hypothetical protein